MNSNSALAWACSALVAAAAAAQFPLGPGGQGPQPVVDPAINEYIVKSVAEHATGASFCGNANPRVELVSARRQGELVFVFSRVSWSSFGGWRGKRATEHLAEVQYSMVQRRLNHCVYEIWCRETRPRVYEHYDLSRIRTRINEELHRYDKIAGDTAFPPYPRGPSTMIPQYVPPGSAPAAAPAAQPTVPATVLPPPDGNALPAPEPRIPPPLPMPAAK